MIPVAVLDPQSELDADIATSILPEDGPVPQANSVAKVVAVVDAVTEGCSSAAEIAEAIGFSGRQGAYYLHAARSLGLVERPGNVWVATELGAELAGADAPERCKRICAHIASCPEVQTYILDSPDALRQAWSSALSETTIERRITAIEAWATWYLASAAEQSLDVSTASASTRALAAQIRDRRAEAQAHRPQRRACSSCGLVLPSGSDTCDLCG